ncbi:SCO6745 family protein [Mycolicibacterium diernhoferi]|uniref:EvbL n=1 Tax=Mycolicibacterium diernhoferi TaxID=1801 RepID=A0A2A7NNW8_9MYCO|nr:evbL [Mycolicibacterium diernhoferi]PEG52046.1 evbL [Mycolicibacterium diernhoferi]QYL20865.1 evbL [Mycolicibacterium diernhoferi]
MSAADLIETTATAGAAIEQAVAVFMLHPQTYGESVAAGYENPLAGYVAGRGGVLGDATGATVSAAFAVFEPAGLSAMWEEGIAVRGAAGAAEVYWNQAAEFGRKYLADAQGVDRIAALGEKLIAVAPIAASPLFAGWRAMPLAEDAPARALQVMFVLRELRAGLHFNALSLAGVSPIEAHMLNKGPKYAAMFGWPEPYADGADKKDRYEDAERATNRRMAELVDEALDAAEAQELARLTAAALETVKANVPS